MKNILLYTLLFLLAASSCKEKTEVEPDKWALPPLTSEGANTFGCLINGEPFVADLNYDSWGGGSSTPDATFYNKEIVVIYGKDDDMNRSGLSVVFPFNSTLGKQKLPYSSDYGYSKFLDYAHFGGRQYRVIDSDSCWVNIASYTEDEFISGTFQFTGVSAEGDTVKITDGRFDIALD